MVGKVLTTITEHRLFAPGDKLVVAVSGGADSVALLDVLAGLEGFHLRLVVAHLNHRLRGEESDGDEAFVRELAARYGIPAEIRGVDVKGLSREKRLSLEEAGRVARYAFFREVAATHQASGVVLAHHADDQAETVLMRLLRGSGGTGLCGMPCKSPDGRYVRPFLGVSRREIEGYLEGRGLSYRVDSSNADRDFLRNRVRHELIPYLCTYNPAMVERLVTTAATLAADEFLLEGLTDQAFARYGVGGEKRVSLATAGVTGEPRGARLRLYRRALLTVKGDLARVCFRHLEDIDRLAFSPKPHATLSLPGGVEVGKSYGEITFTSVPAEKSFPSYELLVAGPGIYALPGGATLAVEEADAPEKWDRAHSREAYFDLDAAPFPWVVRSSRAGDRFTPLGMTGRKKVKDLYIDEKIPRHLRRRIPLLFCGEELIWVCGVRVAGHGRLSGATATVVRAEIHLCAP